jgi:hypothetical protein
LDLPFLSQNYDCHFRRIAILDGVWQTLCVTQTALEHRIREWNVQTPLKPREAPVSLWLHEQDVRLLSRGIQHRVYRIENEPWVVKEARWDLELDLFQNLTIPLHAEMTESILKQFSLSFLPTGEHMHDQRTRYRKAAAYLGYRSDRSDAELSAEQQAVRDRLPQSLDRLQNAYGIVLPRELDRILSSPASRHNFLPEEHLLYGESYAPENREKKTFYLFQEFIRGHTLHDTDLELMSLEHRQQLTVFLTLMLLMYEEIGLVPDMRPRYLITEAVDWLAKTDNVIVGEKGLVLIDTGWFWERHAPLVRRGIILPERTIGHAKSLLLKLLEE